VHGTDAYSEAVEAGIRLARDTAELIRAEYPHLEVVREPELSCLVYRRRGWQAEDYYAWSEQLLKDQVGFVTPTGWEGEVVSRFAFLHPGTTMEMVREILDTMA
jgi:aromatic-L-amino-acid/L-tryptophan decarboxylase